MITEMFVGLGEKVGNVQIAGEKFNKSHSSCFAEVQLSNLVHCQSILCHLISSLFIRLQNCYIFAIFSNISFLPFLVN